MLKRFPELGFFPVAVRRIAYEKKLRMEDVIAKSGISKSTFYSSMVTREDTRFRIPTMGTFFAVADGLGVSPEELISVMRKAEKETKKKGLLTRKGD